MPNSLIVIGAMVLVGALGRFKLQFQTDGSTYMFSIKDTLDSIPLA